MAWKIRPSWTAAGIILLTSAAFSPVARAQSSPPAAGPHKTVGAALQGDQDGVQVTKLVPGSPAEKAGLRVGDQVVTVSGIPILELDQATLRTMADTAKSIIFVVMRDGQKNTFEVVPAVMSGTDASPGRDTARRSPSR